MRPDHRTLAGVLLLVGVAVAAVAHSPAGILGAVERLVDDPLLFGAAVVGLYLLRPLVLWPTTLVAVVVGFGYGLAGLPVALAGAVATSVPPFYAARWLGADHPRIEPLAAAGARCFGTTGHLRGVIAGRLLPIPADAVTVAAALSGVRFRTFAAGVLVGELPWTVAAVVVGASMATLSAEGLGAVGTPIAILTALAGAALLAGPAYRHLAGGRQPEVEAD